MEAKKERNYGASCVAVALAKAYPSAGHRLFVPGILEVTQNCDSKKKNYLILTPPFIIFL